MRIRCPNCHHGLEIVPDTPADFITCPSCGSQLDPNSGETVTYKPETRQVIGHFELLEHVGRGHFGNVWRARDTQLKRIVAVKIPRTADLTESDRMLFLREAQTAARLRHANIVTVHDVGHDADAIFIVSDFIQGVPLSEQLKIRQPSFTEAARWCAAIADALDYAHEQGVIHRDMKPGNIMLEGEDKLFVLDFGLAKTEGGDFTITTEGEILGTPAYMSPEQARGDAASADRRSDVYSLGVVLYEMLTGEKPFQGGTRSLIHQILNEEPKSPRRLKRDVPRDLETICLRAMAKEPSRRYATAKEMADDLRRYLAGEPIHARPVRWPERSWRWVKRNPALSIASGVAAVAVLLLIFQFGRWLTAGPPQAPIVVQGPAPKDIRITVLKRESDDPKANTSDVDKSEVIFWRLDPLTGDPDLKHPEANAGKSPLEFKLVPGDYLVVAIIDERRFHEVYRHVPGEGEGLLLSHNHTWSEPGPGDTLKLPNIVIPPADELESGMAKVRARDFTMGSKSLTDAPEQLCHVSEFLLDPYEVTVAEYGRYFSLHPSLAGKDERRNHPVTQVSWHYATAYAEKLGKRLPEEIEYEAAATDYGTTVFPWGDDATLITTWNLGDVGSPGYDRTKTEVPVWNLFSNAGEWTASWYAPYLDVRMGINAVNPQSKFERVVRGAPSFVIDGRASMMESFGSPRVRYPVHVSSLNKPGVGFRCARSLKPRRNAAEFTRQTPKEAAK